MANQNIISNSSLFAGNIRCSLDSHSSFWPLNPNIPSSFSAVFFRHLADIDAHALIDVQRRVVPVAEPVDGYTNTDLIVEDAKHQSKSERAMDQKCSMTVNFSRELRIEVNRMGVE